MGTAALALVLVAVGCGGGGGSASGRGTSGGGGEGDEPIPERVPLPTEPLSPDEAARAETQALRSFVRARELQATCQEGGNEGACARSRQLFRVAADTWNALNVGRPDDAEAQDWTFMHAQALWRCGEHQAAAEVAERYVRTGTNAMWRRTAAELLIAARVAALEDGEPVPEREAPPEPSGQPPAVTPIELPPALRSLYDARALYVEMVPPEADEENQRRQRQLENALMLHRYGQWAEARPALHEIFQRGCGGEGAWEGAAAAWRALREMSIALGQYDAVAALGRELAERSCTFGTADAPACDGDDEDPRCLAQTDAVSGQLRTGISALQRARHAPASQRGRLGTTAGMAFLATLENERNLAPLTRVAALTQAGAAFRLAGNAELAAEVDRRMVDDVVPAGFDGEERTRVIAVVASALIRLLDAARSTTQHEDVVRVAALLLTEEFDLPELAERRALARQMLPPALAALNRHREAADAWAALATAQTDPAQQRESTLRSALALADANDCRRAGTALRAFAQANRGQAGAGDTVVRALHRYATCQRAGRARDAAMDEVAAAAAEAPETLSDEAKRFAAEATFALVDRDFAGLAQLRVTIPRGANTEALPEDLREAMTPAVEELGALIEGYDRVASYEDPQWTAAAHLRAGLALERMVEVVLAAGWSVPEDLEAQRRGLHPSAFQQLRGIVETRVREVLETQARPIRCRAASRFFRAANVAQIANIESPHADQARARTAALGDVVARCRSANPAAFR